MTKPISQVGVGVALFILAVVFSGCSKSEQSGALEDASKEQVYAVVGGHPITQADLEREYERRRLSGLPPLSENEAVEHLIERAALVQRARDLGIDEDPVLSYRMDSLMIHALRQRSLGGDPAFVQVSEEAIAAEYRERLDDFTLPGATRIAVLFAEVTNKLSVEQDAEAKARLEKALKLYRSEAVPAPKGFGRIAGEYSDEQLSRYRGGDVGWIEDGLKTYRIPDSILEIGRDLEIGQLSEIIAAENGYWVVMKTGERRETVRPLEAVDDLIRSELLALRQAESDNAHIAEAMGAIDIQRLTEDSDDS
jgi:hypothetical protein